VVDRLQAVGEFLAWAWDAYGLLLCQWETTGCVLGPLTADELLAEFFEIDAGRLEKATQRGMNEGRSMTEDQEYGQTAKDETDYVAAALREAIRQIRQMSRQSPEVEEAEAKLRTAAELTAEAAGLLEDFISASASPTVLPCIFGTSEGVATCTTHGSALQRTGSGWQCTTSGLIFPYGAEFGTTPLPKDETA
jgi:hypothetical protein